MKRRVEISPEFVGRQDLLHPVEKTLDFVPAFFQEYIEKLPGLGVHVPDVDAAATEVVQASLVKGMKLPVVLEQFFC
jgi:hypothetical protein